MVQEPKEVNVKSLKKKYDARSLRAFKRQGARA
jgi:hypothetical protein